MGQGMLGNITSIGRLADSNRTVRSRDTLFYLQGKLAKSKCCALRTDSVHTYQICDLFAIVRMGLDHLNSLL